MLAHNEKQLEREAPRLPSRSPPLPSTRLIPLCIYLTRNVFIYRELAAFCHILAHRTPVNYLFTHSVAMPPLRSWQKKGKV